MTVFRYTDILNLDVVDLTECSAQQCADWAVQHVEELSDFLVKADGKIIPSEIVRISCLALQAASLARSAANLRAAAEAAQSAVSGSAAVARGPSESSRRAAGLGRCIDELLTLLQLYEDTSNPKEMVVVIRLSVEAALMELTASMMRASARTARMAALGKMQAASATAEAGAAGGEVSK